MREQRKSIDSHSKMLAKNVAFPKYSKVSQFLNPIPQKNVDFSCKRSDFAIKNEKNFLLLIDYRDIL